MWRSLKTYKVQEPRNGCQNPWPTYDQSGLMTMTQLVARILDLDLVTLRTAVTHTTIAWSWHLAPLCSSHFDQVMRNVLTSTDIQKRTSDSASLLIICADLKDIPTTFCTGISLWTKHWFSTLCLKQSKGRSNGNNLTGPLHRRLWSFTRHRKTWFGGTPMKVYRWNECLQKGHACSVWTIQKWPRCGSFGKISSPNAVDISNQRDNGSRLQHRTYW